jgi:hypothetical protein
LISSATAGPKIRSFLSAGPAAERITTVRESVRLASRVGLKYQHRLSYCAGDEATAMMPPFRRIFMIADAATVPHLTCSSTPPSHMRATAKSAGFCRRFPDDLDGVACHPEHSNSAEWAEWPGSTGRVDCAAE